MNNKHTTSEYQKMDSAHHMHPFSDTKGLIEQGPRVMVKADGVWIWDSEGNKILDGMAGLWCVAVGYGRQELIDAATKQLQTLPFYNTFFKTTHPAVVELSQLLSEVSPEGFNHVFYTGSGSEANDTMLRMVRRYWDIKGQPKKKTIIARKNAYHGSTVAGASLGGMKYMHEQGDLPIPGIVHIDQPYWYREGGNMTPDEFGLFTAKKLEEKIKELGVENVAAFIAEPIQGAGGVIIPPDTYWPEIQRICDEYGILLVADEVICGFGRTGEWFASQTYNIRPDLICIAKGLTSGYIPMGGLLVGDRVAKVMIEEGGDFNHGFTYSGHPVAAAVAIANIKLMQKDHIIENVKNVTAPYLAKRWAELADHPIVGEARTKGLLGALELTPNKATRAAFTAPGKSAGFAGLVCRDFCFKNNLIMRATGEAMIISPPLIITKEEIDELIRLAKLSLDQTAEALGVK
jgi:putrescine aminotransferase